MDLVEMCVNDTTAVKKDNLTVIYWKYQTVYHTKTEMVVEMR